jgi:hypothetical protein
VHRQHRHTAQTGPGRVPHRYHLHTGSSESLFHPASRALGVPTRGTTHPNRLRRVDRWLVGAWLAGAPGAVLRAAADPLVVDLGYGSSPVTTVELYDRLRVVRAGVRVVGLETDPARVAAAAPAARPPALTFAAGGFDLGGRTPVIVRAMNVLRQYPEPAVGPAVAALGARIAPGGLLIEGTCDEIGRRACWFATAATPVGGVVTTLTLSTHLPSLGRPSDLAERLPKSLISRNIPGERVHSLLSELDHAWATAAPRSVFGPRQRWIEAAGALRDAGWPVLAGPRRWRLGELTVRWDG